MSPRTGPQPMRLRIRSSRGKHVVPCARDSRFDRGDSDSSVGEGMRMDSTQVLAQSIHSVLRLDRSAADLTIRRYYWMDVLGSALGLLALVEHFRARAAYSTYPLCALIFPALFCAFSPGYRRRAIGWLGGEWRRVEAYSAGGGAIPWLGAV